MTERAKNSLLFVASVTVALLVCELVVRLYFPQLGWRLFDDKALGWSSQEYQQFAPSTEPNDGSIKRILFVGDSFIAGAGIDNLDDRFPIVFEQELEGRVSVQIIASAGWGTDQQYLAFVQKGKAWQPDIVVIAFCATNDISNNVSNTNGWDKFKPYFVVNGGGDLRLYHPFGSAADISSILLDRGRAGWAGWAGWARSYLIDLIRYVVWENRGKYSATETPERDMEQVDQRYRKFDYSTETCDEIYEKNRKLLWSPQNGINSVSAYIHEDFELNSYQWKLEKRILVEFKKETDDINAELIMMLLPIPLRPQYTEFIVGSDLEIRFDTPDGPFTFRAAEPRDRLDDICGQLGIRLFDPTGEFIDTVVENGLALETWPDPGDRHFSAVGHNILAGQLREYFTEYLDQ